MILRPAVPQRAFQACSLAVACFLAACGTPKGVVDKCESAIGLPPSVSTDILFVIDNSGSMQEEQQKVVDQLQGFVTQLVNAPVKNDFQIGVISTAVTQNFVPCGGGAPVCVAFDAESGRLQQGKNANGQVIDPGEAVIVSSAANDPQFVEKVKRLVGQGVSGSGQEMGLEAIRRAVSEPLVSTPTGSTPRGNAGFLRPGSRLLVVVVSDEDDCSDPQDCSLAASRLAVQGACGNTCTTDAECGGGEGNYCLYQFPTDATKGRRCSLNACETADGRLRLPPVSAYVDFLKNLDDGTGTGRKREVYLAVIGAVDAAGVPARCKEGTDEAYGVAVRYRSAVDAMGDHGLIDSICSASYGATLTRIAELVNAPQTVELQGAPPDGRLLQFEVTRAALGTVQTCKYDEGFDYDPPVGELPARATFKGECRLKPGDRLAVKFVCAG